MYNFGVSLKKYRRASEQHHESLENGPKVVVAFDGTARIEVNVAKQLHPHNGVDEEQHHH